MDGQWIGEFAGTNRGTAIVDLDDCGDHYEGHASIVDATGGPIFTALIKTRDKNPRQVLELFLLVLHPSELRVLDLEEIPQIFPNVEVPTTANVTFEIKSETLEVEWATPVGTFGSGVFPKSSADQPSEYLPEKDVSTWDEFKRFAIKQEAGHFIFRGQSRPFRLRTSFHRTKRKDLLRFMKYDIPALHRAVVARGHHLFNLTEVGKMQPFGA